MPDDDEKSVEEAYLDDLTKSRGWYVTNAVGKGKYKVALEGEKNGRLPTLDTYCDLTYSISLPLSDWKLKQKINLSGMKLNRILGLWTEVLTQISVGSRILIYVPTDMFYETYPGRLNLAPPKVWLEGQVTPLSKSRVLGFDIEMKSCDFLRQDLMSDESRMIVISVLGFVVFVGILYVAYVSSFAQRMSKEEEKMSNEVLEKLKNKHKAGVMDSKKNN